MSKIRSSDFEKAKSEGRVAQELPSFDIGAFKQARRQQADINRFLEGYRSRYSANMTLELMRHDNGMEVDPDAALEQFARQFQVMDWTPAQRSLMWGLIDRRGNASLQMGLPVVLAEPSSPEPFHWEDLRVFFLEVPPEFRAKLKLHETVEAVAIVWQPKAPWTGDNGRVYASTKGSAVTGLWPFLVPFTDLDTAEAWYHMVRACVAHLWRQANGGGRRRPSNPDLMDEAELAGLLSGAPEHDPWEGMELEGGE